MSKPPSLSARQKTVASPVAKHIWVVEGSSGQYEDYRAWIVCAYLSREEAEKHMALAKERARELYERYAQAIHIVTANDDDNAEWPKMGKNQWDANMSTSEESSYTAYSIPLRAFATTQTIS